MRDLYAPFYQPWRSAEWRARLRVNDPLSLDCKYLLYQFMSDAVARCPGEVAECGVYRGGTAFILASRLQEAQRTLHLFDTFAFVHIDLDIHDAILAATGFLYSRMPSGAIIVYDDHGFPSCPGARAAVDTFFADKPEIPIVLPTAQCVVWKR
uniref:Uncharacterized protein n=1 Tax=uncultured organism TaxID=155900 RepID=A0A7L9QD86_9ZZZZ|nr:hypothetical protein [uncultured organism]